MNKEHLLGDKLIVNEKNFSAEKDFKDHKIKFVTQFCEGKNVLDIGCVQHNPENYKSKFWLHGAIKSVAKSLVGIDLYKEGVDYLADQGFNVIYGDAQSFKLDQKFDVIVAGDLVEHLANMEGFINCCAEHLEEGGCVLVSTPNPWCVRRLVKVLFSKKGEIHINEEHTCWFCPRTIRQVFSRYGLKLNQFELGSRKFDRYLPLPKAFKHTTFHYHLSR